MVGELDRGGAGDIRWTATRGRTELLGRGDQEVEPPGGVKSLKMEPRGG